MIVKNTFDMSIKFLLLTFIGLNFLKESWASDNNPAISLGMYCKQVYLIQLYDSGWVEYRGLSGVKTLGKRNTVIKPSVVRDLLKQAEDAGFFLADNRLHLPDRTKFPRTAIRIQKGEKSATLLDANEALQLKNDILKIKTISSWIGEEDNGCVYYDGASTNDLKIKN
jgi:hypothetical protein